MSAKRKERLDGMDAELIRETLRTPGWRKIQARLLSERERRAMSLLKPQGEIETAISRGYCDALATALRIPEILIAEAKDKPVPRTDEREV